MAIAAICCGLAACQIVQEEYFPGEARLTATIEVEPETRTTLNHESEHVSNVYWSENDEIGVFIDGASQAETFRLVEGAGNYKGVFNGKGEGSRYVAFYPSSMLPSRSGDAVRFTLPYEQAYAPGSFSSGACPMIAVSGTPELHFRNLASIVRLSITGRHAVTRIVFRSNDPSVKVTGKATASFSDPQSPVLTMVSGACDSLVLSVPRVKLDEDSATDFYLVLPPQTYKKGFTVRVYTDSRYMDKVYSSDFTTVRSRIHKADPFVFQPNGIDVSTFLEGSGTEQDPFLIRSISDLALVRDAVNAGASIPQESGEEVEASTAAYLLASDIDMSSACGKAIGKSWTPIGDDKHGFSGRFDGNGHVIDGLYINSGRASQGLFGVIGSDTFISNLTVRGDVTSSGDYVSLIAGQFNGSATSWIIYNCSAEGKVKGRNYVAGILGGGDVFRVFACVNRADVTGNQWVGGILGDTWYGRISKCMNYGSISASNWSGGIVGAGDNNIEGCSNYGNISCSGEIIGGIIGYQNAGVLASCQNTGEVSGRVDVGGISGFSRQGSRVWNNVNRGKVSGKDNVGGICGRLSSNSGSSILQSCINLGQVSLSGGNGNIGGVCGKNEGPFVQSNAGPSTTNQNYWLFDAGKGMGIEKGIGLDEGISSDNVSLTDAQMKGDSCGNSLYQGYDVIVDALNGWAYAQRNTYELQGWTYSGDDGYPILTGMAVQPPGSDHVLFSVNINDVDILASGGVFEVEVKSSEDYSVQTPSWISETAVQGFEADRYTKLHTFRVSYNDSGSDRVDVVSFTNEDGTTLSVRVLQKAPYLILDASDIILSANGGAKRISLTSSLPWIASSDAVWCTVSPASGEGDGAVMVKVPQNDDPNIRTARIHIASTDGTSEYTINVVQSGYKPQGEGDWMQQGFVHKSLAMRYTATWCGWCPRMNKSIQRAQELYPDKISYLVIHGGGSDLQFDNADDLMDQYNIDAFPTGLVDGRVKIGNSSIDYTAGLIVAAAKETEETYGTVTGIDISSTLSNRSATVDVGVYVKKAGNYKVTVLLLEDNIINAQSDNEEGYHSRYVHDNVARVALTNVLGDSFKVDKDLTVKKFSFNVDVPSSYNVDNMHILVYVQRAFGSMPVIQTEDYGGYFVDNSAEVTLGRNLRLALEGGGGGSGGEGGEGNEGIVPGDDIHM